MLTVMSDNQIAIEEGEMIQFARQLYDMCLERHGRDHEQTRIAREYLSCLESDQTRT
jgi:hypothetical protein